MKSITRLMMVGAVALLPMQALAADNAPAGENPAPMGMGGPMHGMHKPGEAYWKKLDTNGDGFVGKDEWMANAEKRFKEIDTNGDGKISHEEMDAWHEKMREHFRQMRERHREMMDHMMDQNQGAPAEKK